MKIRLKKGYKVNSLLKEELLNTSSTRLNYIISH
jgi:hypothetical protein